MGETAMDVWLSKSLLRVHDGSAPIEYKGDGAAASTALLHGVIDVELKVWRLPPRGALRCRRCCPQTHLRAAAR